jgi:hypothetical protein
MHVQVIGVPFNSSGRGNGVALAPSALRRAGLLRRLAAAGLEVSDAADVEVGAMAPQRNPRSGLVAEEALVTTIHNTGIAVTAAHRLVASRWCWGATVRSCSAAWPSAATAMAAWGCAECCALRTGPAARVRLDRP